MAILMCRLTTVFGDTSTCKQNFFSGENTTGHRLGFLASQNSATVFSKQYMGMMPSFNDDLFTINITLFTGYQMSF